MKEWRQVEMENRIDIGKAGLDESSVVKKIERKQAKQSMMLFWICLVGFFVGIVGTVILWQKVNNQNLEGIEKVQVRVVDVTKKNIKVNGKNNISYEVTVEYKGQEYKLEDGGHSPWTSKGYKGTAYMYEDRIYANEDGPASRTSVGTIYFVFLFATLGLLFITPSVGSKAFKLRKKLLEG